MKMIKREYFVLISFTLKLLKDEKEPARWGAGGESARLRPCQTQFQTLGLEQDIASTWDETGADKIKLYSLNAGRAKFDEEN